MKVLLARSTPDVLHLMLKLTYIQRKVGSAKSGVRMNLGISIRLDLTGPGVTHLHRVDCNPGKLQKKPPFQPFKQPVLTSVKPSSN